MLGLGQSLTHSSFTKEPRLPFSYAKNIFEIGDGWSTTSLEGNATIDFNVPAPDLSTGWMKITLDTAQTDFWGIKNEDIVLGTGESGATATIQYDIFLNTALLWGDGSANDDDIIVWSTQYDGRVGTENVTAELATTVTEVIGPTTSSSSSFLLRNLNINEDSADLPLAGAEIYLRNLTIDIIYS